MKVFRYAISCAATEQVLDMPLNAQLLSVAPGRMMKDIPADAEHIDLWALVPEMAPEVPYRIHLVGTGHPMPDELARLGVEAVGMMRFIGTAVMPSHLVWHVFWSVAR